MFRSKESQVNAKLSSYFMAIIFVMIIIAIVTLLVAGMQISLGGDTALAGLLAIIGVFLMGLSVTYLYQNKKRTTAMKNEVPKVMTTIECKKCGTKNVREHQRGDFVYKEIGACQKCNDQQLITAIFKEVKEKEKTYSF